MQERFVQDGLSLILARLREARHPDTALYETFLQPTDDEIVHPYLTYDNVLVWRALQLLADWRPAQRGSLLAEADAVRAAIFTHCVKRMQTDSRILHGRSIWLGITMSMTSRPEVCSSYRITASVKERM